MEKQSQKKSKMIYKLIQVMINQKKQLYMDLETVLKKKKI